MYVQPYACYELGCLLLGRPEVRVLHVLLVSSSQLCTQAAQSAAHLWDLWDRAFCSVCFSWSAGWVQEANVTGAGAFKEAAVATLEFELQIQLYIQSFFCGENYCLYQCGMRWWRCILRRWECVLLPCLCAKAQTQFLVCTVGKPGLLIYLESLRE